MDLQLSERSTPSHGYFSPLAPKHSAMLCRRLRRRIGGSLALSLLTLLPAMAGAQTEDGPSLEFTSREYSVNPVAFLWRHGHPWFEDNARSTATLGNLYFDTVKAENSNGTSNGLKFVIEEDPGRSDYQFCYESHHAEHLGTQAADFKDPGCYDVEVGVREDTGLLYLFLDRQIESSDGTIYRDYDVNHYITDFPARAVELSAEDGESELKVYRDVLVGPSERRPDCSDYPAEDVNRYTCLFNRQLLPDKQPSTPQSLITALPKLVQPKENYELVFEENFSATELATLDAAVWNIRDAKNLALDANNNPCESMEDGHYSMSKTSQCGASLNTTGKFTYKYGYLETKTTFNVKQPWYTFHILALVVGGGRRPTRYQHSRYNVAPFLDNYKGISKYLEMEVDVFEYFPGAFLDRSHQYVNWWAYVLDEGVPPVRSNIALKFCQGDTEDPLTFFLPDHGCLLEGGNVTVTRGLEWTPRGYRKFIKVDGVHDDWMMIPKDSIEVESLPGWIDENGKFRYSRSWSDGTLCVDECRDKYFEYLDENDTDSLIEKVGVSHMPLLLDLVTWGRMQNSDNTVRTKMRFDYIRVFQPKNDYADMEPVYQ